MFSFQTPLAIWNQKNETKTKKEASNLIILTLHCCLYKEFAGPLDQIDKKVG